MQPLDPDFEYPHHKDIANQLKLRLASWSKEQHSIIEGIISITDLQAIIADLEEQVLYYETNRTSVKLPDLSNLVQVPLEEDAYILYYHYKLLRQHTLQKRLSASQIISELLENYEHTTHLEKL